MASAPQRWFGTPARPGRVVLATLLLLAAVRGPWGGGPLRAGDPPHTTAKEGEEKGSLFHEDRDIVPPLRADLLDHVTDSAGLPILPDKPPAGDPRKERAYLILADEYEAYCDAVIKAARTPSPVFASHALADVTYAHLFNQPRKYRGQVVRVEGELHRVREFDAPLAVAQAGVPKFYEGWIFCNASVNDPVCVVFTDLPHGIPVAERLRQRVSFDGYFFKKYRYKARDSKPGTAREAPLLIGHGPVAVGGDTAGTPSATVWTGWLLTVLLLLVVGTLALALALHWWFHRGDRQVRRRLAGVREAPVPDWAAAAGAEPRIEPPHEKPTRWPPDPSAS
jgi:hypothetical protein